MSGSFAKTVTNISSLGGSSNVQLSGQLILNNGLSVTGGTVTFPSNSISTASINGISSYLTSATAASTYVPQTNPTFNTIITQNCGGYNQSFGSVSCFSNATTATGACNIGIGTACLQYLTSGSYNLAFGDGNLANISTGSHNIAIGQNIAFSMTTTSNNNVGVGYNNFNATFTAVQYNTAIGSGAGQYSIGSNNTYLGANTGQASGNGALYNNSTAIGYNAVTTASNQITLGTSTETVLAPGSIISTGLLTASNGLTVTAGAITSIASIDKLTGVPWGTTAFNFNTGTNYWMNTGTAAPTTTINFTNMTATSGNSYTFVLILPTIVATNYYNITTCQVAGTTTGVTFKSNISTLPTPSALIVQTFTCMYLGTTWYVITSATSY